MGVSTEAEGRERVRVAVLSGQFEPRNGRTGRIASALNMADQTVYRHLKSLSKAKLIPRWEDEPATPRLTSDAVALVKSEVESGARCPYCWLRKPCDHG